MQIAMTVRSPQQWSPSDGLWTTCARVVFVFLSKMGRLPFRRPLVLVVAGVIFFAGVTILDLRSGDSRMMLLQGSRFWPMVAVPCEPRTDIVFIKTHKCASSSIQNVLLRYGDAHNLTFVLPTRHNYLGHPSPFQRIFVPDNLNKTFNILTHHTRYNRPEMDLIMPRATAYITIVRSPIDLLESLYAYYNLKDYYHIDLEKLSMNRTLLYKTLGVQRYYSRVGLNQMSFDLGFNTSMWNSPQKIHDFVNSIDSEFDLVMVYERLDESLVLMSDLFCWSLEDVVIFKLNARKAKYRKRLSSKATKMLEDSSGPDLALYSHFSRKFQGKVEEYGEERMKAKVEELASITEKLFTRCVLGQDTGGNNNSTRYRSPYVVHYEARNKSDSVCQKMLRDELQYTELLRKKQHSPLD